jgi:hypothetical protein
LWRSISLAMRALLTFTPGLFHALLALFRSRNEQVIVKLGIVIRWRRRGFRLDWPAAALAS